MTTFARALLLSISLGFLVLASHPADARDWTVLRVGIDPTYKPFTYKTEDGQPAGFDIDIANAVCAQMHAKCVFVEQSWEGMIPGLLSNKFDVVISSMSITDERMRAVAFSDKYYQTPSRLVTRKGSGLSTASTLKGKKVGVLKASIQERYARAVFGAAGADVVSFDTQDQAYLDLVSGRVDAVLSDAYEARFGFLKSKEGQAFEVAGPDLTDPKYFGYGVGIALRKGDAPDLKPKLNAAIKAIRADGTYKRLNDKYFDFDVYGS